MALKTDETLTLLMKYRDRAPPLQIAQKLQNNRYYLYMVSHFAMPQKVPVLKLNQSYAAFMFQYMDSLYKAVGKEMPVEFHVQMVHLYADYGPDNLLQFLRASDLYPMGEAFMICKRRKLYPEMIFLLSKFSHEFLDIVLLPCLLADPV